MQSFPQTESTFILPGPAGDLEVLTAPAKPDVPSRAAVAVICHPHPLFGGTMHNKVVTTLARAFSDLGLRTVRFNFRGVGKSAGQFANGVGETEDLLAVVNWVKTVCPGDELWLAGFSFGGYVATRAAVQLSPAQLVCVAPQVSRFKEDALPAVQCPWLVVQGEKDEVVSPEEVFAWVDSLDPKPTLVRVPEAGHFFHGLLLELRGLLETALG